MQFDELSGRRAEVALELLLEGRWVAFRGMGIQLSSTGDVNLSLFVPQDLSEDEARRELERGSAIYTELCLSSGFAAALADRPQRWALLHDYGGGSVLVYALDDGRLQRTSPPHPTVPRLTDGAPDIEIKGLRVWIGGYEDRFSSNSLKMYAECSSWSGAHACVSGPILTPFDIQRWVGSCERLAETAAGEASFEATGLEVRLTGSADGTVAVRVRMSPYSGEEHLFTFEIDQTYLPTLASRGRELLARCVPAERSRYGARS